MRVLNVRLKRACKTKKSASIWNIKAFLFPVDSCKGNYSFQCVSGILYRNHSHFARIISFYRLSTSSPEHEWQKTGMDSNFAPLLWFPWCLLILSLFSWRPSLLLQNPSGSYLLFHNEPRFFSEKTLASSIFKERSLWNYTLQEGRWAKMIYTQPGGSIFTTHKGQFFPENFMPFFWQALQSQPRNILAAKSHWETISL